MAAQKPGFPLAGITDHLRASPDHKVPTKGDRTRISRGFRHDIDARIAALEDLRDKLDGCIGCGCLRLKNCVLYNPAVTKGREGPEPGNLTLLPD